MAIITPRSDEVLDTCYKRRSVGGICIGFASATFIVITYVDHDRFMGYV